MCSIRKRYPSDDEILSVLDENDYLDPDIQDYIYSETDVAILYKTISEVSAILKRKKFKHIENKEAFLNSDDEEALKNFLLELHDHVSELNLKISKAVFDVLKS